MKKLFLSLALAIASLIGYSQKYTIDSAVIYKSETDSVVSRSTGQFSMYDDNNGAFLDISMEKGTITFQAVKLLDKHQHEDSTIGIVYQIVGPDQQTSFVLELIIAKDDIKEAFIVNPQDGVAFKFYLSHNIQQ